MDGLYKLTAPSAQELTMDLRVDITGSFALSGDLYKDGVYLLSWTADAPVVKGCGKYLAYAGTSRHGLVVEISTDIDHSGAATCMIQGLKFQGNFVSRALRKLELVAMVEKGVPPAQYTDALNNLVAAYAAANIDVKLTVKDDALPHPPGGSWKIRDLDAQLDAAIGTSSEAWRLHVLVCSVFERNGVFGVMFDADPFVSRSTGDYERQGFAVFLNPFQSMSDTDPMMPKTRYLFHTFIHELGHALNLAHSFGTRKLRIDSLSYMNYPQNYGNHKLGHRGSLDYWTNFKEKFDAQELMHLRHAFYGEIIPGGFDFEGEGPFGSKHRHELTDIVEPESIFGAKE